MQHETLGAAYVQKARIICQLVVSRGSCEQLPARNEVGSYNRRSRTSGRPGFQCKLLVHRNYQVSVCDWIILSGISAVKVATFVITRTPTLSPTPVPGVGIC